MKTGRLEAFSDGVLAIIITIMVLELKAPEDTTLKGLFSIAPIFVSYVLSFIYLGVYWNNHHHLLQVSQKVNGKILWANLHLLFWLSLIPFTTSWLGENEHYLQPVPVATYGFVLLMSAIAYYILERVLIQHHDENYALIKMCSNSVKDYVSMGFYVVSIPLAYVNTWFAITCYAIVALMWLKPDKKFEELMSETVE